MATRPYRAFNVLTVVAVLVSLLMAGAPAVTAAPREVSEASIDDVQVAGESVNPAFVTANPSGNNTFYLVYSADGTPGNPATATFWLGTMKVGQENIILPVQGRSILLMVPAGTPEGTYKLQMLVEDFTDSEEGATWDGDVIVDNTPPVVPADVFIAPKPGARWEIGGRENTSGGYCNEHHLPWVIRWTENVILDPNLKGLNLYYSADNGATWIQINGELIEPDEGEFEWCAWAPESDQAKLKLQAVDQSGNTNTALSGVFTLWGVSHKPPQVDIEAPDDDAFISGTAYLLQAEAWTPGPDGQGIKQVDFFYSADLGNTWHLIGTQTNSTGPGPHGNPLYLYSWDTTALADGTKVWVKARAVTNADAPGEETHYGIVIDNTPVLVTILKPESGAFVPATFKIKATIEVGPIGLNGPVTFWYKTAAMTEWAPVDCNAQPDTLMPPPMPSTIYAYCLWTPTEEQLPENTVFSLRAVAVSNSGVYGIGQVDNITIDRTRPTEPEPWLVTPNHKDIWETGTDQTIVWKTGCNDLHLAPDPISLYYIDNTKHKAVPIALRIPDTGSFVWTVAGVPSEHAQIKITCEDRAGNKAKDLSQEFVIWSQDETPPDVALTAPNADDLKISTPYTLMATASDEDSGIRKVEFYWAPYDMANNLCGDMMEDPEDWWTLIEKDLNPPYKANWEAENGLYCLKAVAYNGNWWPAEDVKQNILVDNDAPEIEWESPEETRDWVNGTQWLEVEAESLSGIASVSFSYSALCCDDPAAIAIGTATEEPWGVSWDTKSLPDGGYFLIVSATNNVGKTTVDCRPIQVINTFGFLDEDENDLMTGWNLISLPLLPFDEKIEKVMEGVPDVDQVATFVWDGDDLKQKTWMPGGPVHSLHEMTAGVGYWVKMNKSHDMVNHGWFNPEAPEVPPSYDLHAGWNLLGFHVTSPDYMKTVRKYLGEENAEHSRAMYRYVNGVYYPVQKGDLMEMGVGYWLAVDKDGTIFP